LIVFVDDDVVADPALIRVHRDAHARLGDRCVVIGPMLDPPDHAMSPWIAWEQAMLAKQYDDMNAGKYGATARQFYTGNASLRREHVLAIGGFDTTFRRAEDIELAFRLDDHGLAFDFEPEARGLHYAERSYEAWRSAAYTYGRNEIVFARDRGRGWLLRFARERFDKHHRVIRWLCIAAVRSPRVRRTAVAVLERIVRAPRARSLHRYALSGIYAIEFHCGIADELGSPAAFMRLVTTGSP
jgi:GT2 family glycosyltransferase